MTMKLNRLKDKTLIHGDLGVWAVFIILCAISLIEVYSASSRMTFASGAYWDPIMQHGSFRSEEHTSELQSRE